MPLLINVIEHGANAFDTNDQMPDMDMTVHQFLATLAPSSISATHAQKPATRNWA